MPLSLDHPMSGRHPVNITNAITTGINRSLLVLPKVRCRRWLLRRGIEQLLIHRTLRQSFAMYSSLVINPFSIRSFASASVCARLETRSSSNLTGFLSGFCHCFSYVDFLMDFPLPRRFRFGRLGSTRTCVAFFAMN